MQQETFVINENSVELKLTKEENIEIERNYVVNMLRIFADNSQLKDKEIYIPDGCEMYGFVEGKFNIGHIMRFFADMLEE